MTFDDRLRLVAFRRENRFRIRTRYFARLDPAEAADKRANQKRNCCERDLAEQAENECERTGQNLADPNEPP